MVGQAFLCCENASFMQCRKNKPSKSGWVGSKNDQRCCTSLRKSLVDALGGIGSRGCMAFVLKNTVDLPICNLFEASLPCRFILTFPLMPFLKK
jgi:hypothetical protein